MELIPHISSIFKDYSIKFGEPLEVTLKDRSGKKVTIVINTKTRELIEIR